MTGFCRIENEAPLPAHLRGGVVAIGNFDGVHRGHQAVLEAALALAAARGCPALVLTFEPHPRTAFQPDRPVCRLTPAAIKARLISALGFDAVIEWPFNADFASRSAEDFVAEILVGHLGVSAVVAGFDFHFGHGREGGPDFLRAAGERHGFSVHHVQAFRDEGDAIISSSRVRQLLAEGELGQANGLLGYRLMVEAEVIGGQKLGRTLGYPTANMSLPAATDLKTGIYAVRFRKGDGQIHDGVASFGRRPTVTDNGEPLLETFLFDFSGDLYGQICTVSFFGRLRDELKFNGLDPLMEQMRKDEAEARNLLSGVARLGALDAAVNF